jgi:hypothetical protein
LKSDEKAKQTKSGELQPATAMQAARNSFRAFVEFWFCHGMIKLFISPVTLSQIAEQKRELIAWCKDDFEGL